MVKVADTESFDAFYRSTYDRTLRYLYGMLGDAAEAQDIAQETYGRSWLRWKEVGRMADPEAWVRTVGWRVAANHLRHLGVARRRRMLRQEVVAAPDVAAPDVDKITLMAALKRIDPAQRRALILHYLLDLPVQQVAAETGASVSATKARLARGRAALAVLLSRSEETSDARRG